MLKRFLLNYVQRHRNRANQLFHLAGLPLTFVVPVVLLVREQWAWAGVCFVAGYGLQFLGHACEGNDAGEAILLKKWLGRPYREFGPAVKQSKNTG